MNNNPLKIRQIHHIEFYVGNAKQADYYYRNGFGFSRIAYLGLETGDREKTSYALKQGTSRLVVTSPHNPDSEISEHIRKHGDGVKDIALEVDDADYAFDLALKNGAEAVAPPYSMPSSLNANFGEVRKASVKIYGDTIHSFISRKNYSGPFLPGFIESNVEGRSAGLLRIDHFVANVELGKMVEWEEWYKKIFGFSRFMTFDDKDISTEYSALQSIVMANDSKSIKFPINEPAPGLRKSQIEEYLDCYKSPGVQHIALLTDDIISSVSKLRENGIDFLEVPDSYYDELSQRVGHVDEDIQKLKKLKLLVDADEDGYLLQIFTKPVEDRPTLFYEIIQRKGCQGFGKGNFKALFEAIEREQASRGNLV